MGTNSVLRWVVFVIFLCLLLTGCAAQTETKPDELEAESTEVEKMDPGRQTEGEESASGSEENSPIERGIGIVTLLPKDAIRSIDNPRFYSAEDADREYEPEELVLGVEIDGQARAYSVDLLSSHEIVNDVVAGVPIAVTW